MVQAAKMAGIHRFTLNRWEKGDTQPHLPELNALLTALGADARQKQTALQLMEAPRAVRQIRSEIAQITELSGMPSLPHGGELLYALRMRRGLSLDEAARSVGVTGGTLRRWEKMEVWPSSEQLHRLCYFLKAQEGEIVALTLGRFSRMARLEKVSLDAIEERLQSLDDLFDDEGRAGRLWTDIPMLDMTYLHLEADAWPLALRSAAGKQQVIHIYGSHAQSLSCQERLVEAGQIAERALELIGNKLKPEKFWMYPVIVSARARGLGGERATPKRGLERLRPWASMTQWPDLQAWLLADMAKYLGMSGEPEAALTVAEQACRVAENAENPVELCFRKWDKASLLLQAGRPGEALTIVEERADIEDRPSERIDISLLRAEAYLGTGDRTQAHDWVQAP